MNTSSITVALQDAGLEVFQHIDNEIQLAERIRMHLMDSGVKIQLTDPPKLIFVARSQKSERPQASSEEHFEAVRSSLKRYVEDRGYQELNAYTTEIKDPVDSTKILDVWHEVAFFRDCENLETLVHEAGWAIALDKVIVAS